MTTASPTEMAEAHVGGSRPGRHRVRNAAITAALLLSLASVIALLLITQPFADAVGACGGG